MPHLIRRRLCSALITERKERSITKMSAKLDSPETTPKTYW